MLQYYKTGLSNGPCVILVHGFPNDHNCWNPILKDLENDFQVILIDLPGAGGSEGVERLSLSTVYMADEIELLVKSLNIADFVLIGHSMGGYTSMEYLSKYSNRLKGVSMVHSLASADEPEKLKQRLKAIDLIYHSSEGQRNFLKAMANNLFATDFSEIKNYVNVVVEQGMKLSQDEITNFYHAIMNRNNHVNTLIGNKVPIQWIIGEKDQATPKDLALQQSHLAIINDVKIYAGVGHMSMYECPNVLARDLSEFCHFCWKS